MPLLATPIYHQSRLLIERKGGFIFRPAFTLHSRVGQIEIDEVSRSRAFLDGGMGERNVSYFKAFPRILIKGDPDTRAKRCGILGD